MNLSVDDRTALTEFVNNGNTPLVAPTRVIAAIRRVLAICDVCHGTRKDVMGYDTGAACTTCNGTGEHHPGRGLDPDWCSECGGSGDITGRRLMDCPVCNGTGKQ